MDEEQFILALDDVAEAYYDQDYDAFFGTSVTELKLEQKREMLYQFLECDRPTRYKKKLQGFARPVDSRFM
jgi:hypothetical protein